MTPEFFLQHQVIFELISCVAVVAGTLYFLSTGDFDIFLMGLAVTMTYLLVLGVAKWRIEHKSIIFFVPDCILLFVILFLLVGRHRKRSFDEEPQDGDKT